MKWPTDLSVTVSDCMTVPHRGCTCLFRCHLWISVMPTCSWKSGIDRMQRSKKGDNRTSFLHILTWPHLMGSSTCDKPLTRAPINLSHGLVATSIHLKEKKTHLNKSRKNAEEDYFWSETDSEIYFLFSPLNKWFMEYMHLKELKAF